MNVWLPLSPPLSSSLPLRLALVWVDEVRQIFGGLDMFALDVLHVADGKDVILELNDYAMGTFLLSRIK